MKKNKFKFKEYETPALEIILGNDSILCSSTAVESEEILEDDALVW